MKRKFECGNLSSKKKRRKIDIYDFIDSEINSSQFYGEKKVDALEQRKRKFGKLEDLKEKRTKLIKTCRVYMKQQDAIDHKNKLESENTWLNVVSKERKLRVFAFEFNEGVLVTIKKMVENYYEVFSTEIYRQSRYFLLCSFDVFFEHYNHIAKEYRHFYEVILKGNTCFLYFDIESKFIEKKTEEAILRIFVEELKLEFKEMLDIDITENDIVDLKSSNEKKFSHHIVVKPKKMGKEVIFRNSEQCGRFVQNWVGKLRKRKNSPVDGNEDLKLFFYEAEVGGRTEEKCIIDKSVYTKNRHFRIIYSTKRGRKDQFEMYDETIDFGKNKYKIFMNTLITNTDERNSVIQDIPLSVCKFVDEINPILKQGLHFVPNYIEKNPNIKIEKMSDRIIELEELIVKVVNRNVTNKKAFIRNCRVYKETNFIHYYIGNVRYCERIKREHKSNHVYFVVDLNRRHVRFHDRNIGYLL